MSDNSNINRRASLLVSKLEKLAEQALGKHRQRKMQMMAKQKSGQLNKIELPKFKSITAPLD